MAVTLVDNVLLCEYKERCRIMKQYWGKFQALLRKTMRNLSHDIGCYGKV